MVIKVQIYSEKHKPQPPERCPWHRKSSIGRYIQRLFFVILRRKNPFQVKKYVVKYLIFIIGLYFLAAGIVLILRSSLGTTPISSVNYVLSRNTPITLGTWTFLFNILLIMGQFWFIRDRMTRRDTLEILLQIPFSMLFGVFIDFNMALTETLHPTHYAMAIAMLLTGCLIQAIGVVFEIKPHVVMMSAEGFVNYASQRYNKDFGKIKVGFDISLVTIAVVVSVLFSQRVEGVREGTLIAAGSTGYIVSFLNRKIMTRAMLHRVLPLRRA